MPLFSLNDEWTALLEEYKKDHQHPKNQLCHTIGIPLIAGSIPVALTIVGLPIAVAMFTVGWGFQFLGHAIEKTPPKFISDKRNLFVGLVWWAQKLGVPIGTATS
jgi:uncharacterized membrane protein YGL010W